MFDFRNIKNDNIIAFEARGTIRKEDYDELTPLLEKIEKENNPVKLLIILGDVEGMTTGALLKDIATFFKHVKYIDRIAVVGEGDFHEDIWTKVTEPLIKTTVKYFPEEERLKAERWILG